MMVLSRRRGERVVIGHGIEVKVLEVEGERVKLGFVAPAEVPIHREEVFGRISSRPPAVQYAAWA